jgi:hypothetical protein
MKRYLLFGHDTYYPGGGWCDYLGTYDTIEEVMAYLARNRHENWHIVDTTTMAIVEEH